MKNNQKKREEYIEIFPKSVGVTIHEIIGVDIKDNIALIHIPRENDRYFFNNNINYLKLFFIKSSIFFSIGFNSIPSSFNKNFNFVFLTMNFTGCSS